MNAISTVTDEQRVLPRSARRNYAGLLTLGNIPLATFALRYGTPLYLFDDEHLRTAIWHFRRAFSERLPTPATFTLSYASKAFLCTALVQLMAEERVGLDVNSGGELHIALHGGMPAAMIHMHGNAKSADELRRALERGVGRIVVDNLTELRALDRIAASLGTRAAIWLRVNPGVAVHTHAAMATGHLDSKFGLPIETGDAARAVEAALAAPNLDLMGLHAHIGSSIAETEPYQETARRFIPFAAAMRAQHGWTMRECSPGGGFAVPYLPNDDALDADRAAEAIIGTLVAACAQADFPVPDITIEPGKALVGPAAIALYAVNNIKEITGVRRFVAVDGGMADNIRPALYGAKYTVLLANRAPTGEAVTSTVVGRYCESGDILARDVPLPADLAPGDLLAFPTAGAYSIPMASQYNGVPRPAIVLVREDGTHQLIRRRETYDDLLRADVPLDESS
ncbi:MAG: diaminopimelate decarboxylase [Thermomicrobiales bacterium]